LSKEKDTVLETLEKIFQLTRVDRSQLFLYMLVSGRVKQRSRVIKVVAEISMHFLRESLEFFDVLPQAVLSDAVEGCSSADLGFSSAHVVMTNRGRALILISRNKNNGKLKLTCTGGQRKKVREEDLEDE
jgi:Lon protease-like protein